MSIDVEYAIKKDVRNNPVVREVDVEQKRDFMRTTYLAALIVALLLFSAWQHFELLRHGYQIERMQQERAAEEDVNRHLRLFVDVINVFNSRTQDRYVYVPDRPSRYFEWSTYVKAGVSGRF